MEGEGLGGGVEGVVGGDVATTSRAEDVTCMIRNT